MSAADTERAVTGLLAAIERRDLRAVADHLAPGATWQNVPHPAAVGRDAVVELLAPVLLWSDEVRWDVVSSAWHDGTAWVERVDRFLIDGDEHAVRCNGVVTVADGAVTEVRDYVDLGEWRARISPVLARMAGRSVDAVVARHCAAVLAREPLGMAADYSLDAVLVRGDREHRGWRAIADYFDTVPDRLRGRELSFGPIETDGERGRVAWTIADATGTTASGTDTFEVAGGRIVRQSVELGGTDF